MYLFISFRFRIIEIKIAGNEYEKQNRKNTRWAALVSNSLVGWSLLRLYHILIESVLDVPRKLPADIFLIWTNVTWANVD